MAKEKTEKKITEEKISKQETKIEDKPKTTPLKTKPVAKETPELERIYIIPLREKCRSVPRYKKTNKAVKTIKEFIARHMRVQNRDLEKIKIDKILNEAVWFRGIRSPPHKIKVKATKIGDIVKVELAELSDKYKFKIARLEKREKIAEAKQKTMEEFAQKEMKMEAKEKKHTAKMLTEEQKGKIESTNQIE